MIDDDLNNSDNEEETDSGPDFNYILSMPIYNLTKEKKEELCKKRDEKVKKIAFDVGSIISIVLWGLG